MKRRIDAESGLFDLAAQAVRGTSGLECERRARHASTGPRDEFDGVAILRFRGQHIRLPYVVKRSLDSAALHLSVLMKQGSAERPLIVTSYVNERKASMLRAGGVYFMDTSGNVFLDAPGLHIWVSGRPAERRSTPRDKSRAFNPSGLRLIFALLTDPHLDDGPPAERLVAMPYREIAAVTGLSRSTIGWIMADLTQQGFVIGSEDGERLIVDRKRLLERWIPSYADRLRPRLLIDRYRPARADWWKSADLEGALWSGEVAAAILTSELKPGTATVFGASPSHRFVLEHGLQKDETGTVEFLKPFLRKIAAAKADDRCAHPLLVYADLISIDDERTREVAGSIYERHLRSTIEAA